MTETIDTVVNWQVYINIFSTDGVNVWNVSAFVLATDAARNAGAIPGTDDGDTGHYEFPIPAGVVASPAGAYRIEARRRMGGSPNVLIDRLLTPPIQTIAITTANVPSGAYFLKTGLSRPLTTIYNQTVILPEGDDQIVHFEPADSAEYETSSGLTFACYVSTTEGGNAAPDTTTIAQGAGLTVLDATKPKIQVDFGNLTGMRGYSLVQLTPTRRTAAQGTIVVRRTAAVG